MRVSFIGHAALLIEAGGIRIVSDPWWGQPCFGLQWWNYPLPATELVDTANVDYVYVSHGHADHLHLATLQKFSRRTKVLIPTGTDMAPGIRRAGFTVIEVDAEREFELAPGVTCRIWPTCNDDSLIVVSDGRETCANLNDALHAAPNAVIDDYVQRLKRAYPQMDYVYCGYGIASHFPNCYRIPGKDPAASAQRRQAYFNSRWARIIAALQPKFAFPFAADVAFLEDDLFWANAAVHNGERPTAALARLHPEFRGQALDIAPGFVIADGHVERSVLRRPTDPQRLRQELARGVGKCNQYDAPTRESIEATRKLLADKLEFCRTRLASYRGDYRIVLRLRGTESGFVLRKRGGVLVLEETPESGAAARVADLVMTTRVEYLRWSLSTQYGNETLYVGSGVIFDYPSRAAAERALHREVAVLMKPHASAPAPLRYPNPIVHAAKQFVKRLIGRTDEDLYDLNAWTVWRA
jgi:hypothetical protein